MKKTEAMTVTVPIELRKQLKAMAQKEGRNLSNMVTVLLQRGMRKEKAA
jgi:post-segregation antitoxin (ccd killing protein)